MASLPLITLSECIAINGAVQRRRAGPSAAIEAAVAVTVAIVLREALPAVTDSQLLLLTSFLVPIPRADRISQGRRSQRSTCHVPRTLIFTPGCGCSGPCLKIIATHHQ
ncbi:uncharacterized protein LOC125261115 isoform X5 [Megalobrama amblycephala]|uniref:uncharacterized protein LOC125261115 isoform X5 n=1 Tax=Megalobrama amblycephala TaxID=75352 RepID=UPI0020143C77|nr:uncharacterized protein LOC125261115 isoform X5 [Megalobrama amblycephala]